MKKIIISIALTISMSVNANTVVFSVTGNPIIDVMLIGMLHDTDIADIANKELAQIQDERSANTPRFQPAMAYNENNTIQHGKVVKEVVEYTDSGIALNTTIGTDDFYLEN